MRSVLAVGLVSFLMLFHVIGTVAYHPDFTWSNVDTLMSPDLRGRMKKGAVGGRRKYCGSCPIDPEVDYRICGNNGIMYPNECIFLCSQLTMPGLEEAEDYGRCGTISFTEFKPKYDSHY